MRKTVISAAAIAIVGAGVLAFAQTQSPPPDSGFASPAFQAEATTAMAGMRVSADDRAVLLDARVGAMKAALKLAPDQESLWGPVEAMIRKRADLRNERMHDDLGEAQDGKAEEIDPISRMRARADRMARRAQLLHEFADAAQPLYVSLSADQKRRIFLLMHRARGADVMGHRHGRHGHHLPWRD